MWHYLNNGISITGVPERNLTLEEFRLFELWLQNIIKNSGAYKFVEIIVTEKPKAPVEVESKKAE